MATARAVDLSLRDWAVLGVVAEAPTHGFAVARLMAPDGRIGQVWALPRPVVYNSLDKLLSHDLIRVKAVTSGNRGPGRTIVAVTPAGRDLLEAWLYEPVRHVRDVRSMLLLKLALLDRTTRDAGPLVEAQLELVSAQVKALRRLRDQSEGFERTIAIWRVESSEAVLRFLKAAP
jgi:DNA-binding PadR family transcriptional regulator